MIDSDIFDKPSFDNALAQETQPLQLFQSALRHGKETLQQRFLSGTPATELVPQLSALIDILLQRIWERCFSSGEQQLALVAVGGYGRGELLPGSDVDLLILLSDDEHAGLQPRIERFLAFLWDTGLEVGHSVRNVAECANEARADVTVATNLMESRLLCGPVSLYEAMCDATGPAALWNSRDFFEAKWHEQQVRHQKFHDSGYNLEPNVKEGPGGLRDIHMIGWVVKRHFHADTLQELVEHHFLTEAEYRTLLEGQAFLWDVRFALHTLVGRREDRILFDYQKSLARQFGYQDDSTHLAVEKFMQDYYRTITELGRLNEMLLQLFQEAILYEDRPIVCEPINNRFHSCNGFLEVSDAHTFKRYPFALLELFLLLAQREELRGVRAETIRLVRDHTYLIDEKFRADLRCRSLFMEILRQPEGITQQLRRMNRYGILAAYIPVFGKIVGRMQYDLFHVYTVDDHTLMVMRNLRRFTVPEHSNEFPFCSEIIKRIPKLEILYLAALFHDIAKGRGGDHSELGAVDAEEFCLQHGMGNYDTELVKWLVRNHLLMSMTAQRRDISDPEVIAEFASIVREQSRLDHLYLLTVADIRGTNPEMWNNWKDALLTELYSATKQALQRGFGNILQRDVLIEQTRDETRQLLNNINGVNLRRAEAFWQRLDDNYFLRHDADEIAWQTSTVLSRGNDSLPLVVFREETRRGATEIFFYSEDQDHLFAITTAVLDQMGLDVVDARINTSPDGYTLNSFTVLDESGHPIADRRRLQEIAQSLRDGIRINDLDKLRVTRRLPRRLKHFSTSTEVRFTADPQGQYTFMELVAADRPGLLARIGRAMAEHHIRLHSAKIATFGERVEDIFFITTEEGRPLSDAGQREALARSIRTRLDEDE